jgi:hypothetical protein
MTFQEEGEAGKKKEDVRENAKSRRRLTNLENPLSESEEIHERFKRVANEVLSSHSQYARLQLAELEAKMLWLAWRGDDDYLIWHSGSVAGRESSWKICDHRNIERILKESRSREEFRPITEVFSEQVLASLITQIHSFSTEMSKEDERRGRSEAARELEIMVERIYESSPIPEQRSVRILGAMSLVQEGWTLRVRSPLSQKNKYLSRWVIELSRNDLVFKAYPKLNEATASSEDSSSPSLKAIRGYISFVRHKERLEQQRKKRLGILRWLSTQRD